MRTFFVMAALIVIAGCGRPGGSSSSSGGGGSSGPAAASVVNSRAQLQWGAASGLPNGYIVLESTNQSNWTAVQTATQTSTYVDGLSTGTEYYFRIAAYNSSGTSTSTATLSISL